ncbi:MAG: DUF1538 domain-containing protein [Gammaproteobacteria bacterium]|nr:DUF1538 domain-containing protein [Gammaproteobacteria bacterium]
MVTEIRFGKYLKEAAAHHDTISYNDLIPEVRRDKEGHELAAEVTGITLRPIDVYRLLQPYVTSRAMEQAKAVVPLAVYLMVFQLVILRQGVNDSAIIVTGLFAVIVGLMFFMEGLKIGLMPFGSSLGTTLPAKSSLPVVLIIAFLLGIGVTFAEPAIGALKAAGQVVKVENAPYLYTLLNDWSEQLVLVVGIGVGAAAVLGTVRLLYGWSLKPFIYVTLVPTLLLTIFIQQNDELSKMLGLAWDCGAVTTGPVTVPLVLALGIGIASAAGKGSSSLSGFGIVTLASLFPIIGVELLAIYVFYVTTPEAIIAASSVASTEVVAWYDSTPYAEVIGGLRAIVPLVIFLIIVMKLVLKEKIHNAGIITYGITLAVIGMIIFSLGLTYGLAKLGNQSGGFIPAAFSQVSSVEGSPLYFFSLGILIALFFAWALGFGATLAEPALNALGITVEQLTNGAFKKSTLMYSVSFGVGFGIALGVAKIVFDLQIAYLLMAFYAVAIVLTYLSSEEFVNIAWDSAGVTTGPVTVPLVLSMGLGFANAAEAIEGFGILSMASIGPIIAVQATGIWINMKVKQKRKKLELGAKVQTAAAGI